METIQSKETCLDEMWKKVIVPGDAVMGKILCDHIKETQRHVHLSKKIQHCILVTLLCVKEDTIILPAVWKALLDMQMLPETLREVIYHVIPYTGVSCANKAFFQLQAILEEKNRFVQDTRSDQATSRYEKGLQAQCSVFPKDVILRNQSNAPDDEAHIQRYLSEHCFGDFYTRKHLSMAERELLTFCTIAAIGGCENQLSAHAQANIAAGNSRSDLLDAITFCQPFIGFPRTLNAIAIIDTIIPYKEEQRHES